MKIFVIAPHLDDEVLGCGGTIARHVVNKDEVFVLFIAHRVYSHRFNKISNRTQKEHILNAKRILRYKEAKFLDLPDERLDSCIQDIIVPLENYVTKIKPDIAYCPFNGDNHQDHRAVFDAARVVLRPSRATFLRKFLLYEVPSSTEQSPSLPESAFLPNCYIDVTRFMDKKLKALLCYKTEHRGYPHPRSPKAVKILAQKRGIEIGFAYAEAFMNIREKLF